MCSSKPAELSRVENKEAAANNTTSTTTITTTDHRDDLYNHANHIINQHPNPLRAITTKNSRRSCRPPPSVYSLLFPPPRSPPNLLAQQCQLHQYHRTGTSGSTSSSTSSSSSLSSSGSINSSSR